jgi:L-iditol 2-dehydrogenase
VAIIGAGATGIIHTKLCRLFGASRIIVSDIFDYRLDVSRRSGADVVVNPEREDLNKVVKAKTGGRGVDLAIVTAPNMDAYRAGISVCRKGGTLVIFAPTVPGKHLELSPMDLFFTELKVIPSYSASHLETREALDLIESGRVDVGDLITHRFGLEDAGEAFKTALRNRDSLKVVLFSR